MRGRHGELAESGSPPQCIRLIGHDCRVPYHKQGTGGARSTPHMHTPHTHTPPAGAPCSVDLCHMTPPCRWPRSPPLLGPSLSTSGAAPCTSQQLLASCFFSILNHKDPADGHTLHRVSSAVSGHNKHKEVVRTDNACPTHVGSAISCMVYLTCSGLPPVLSRGRTLWCVCCTLLPSYLSHGPLRS